MNKKEFKKITDNAILKYGFIKKNDKYILELEHVSIVVMFSTFREVKYFSFYFSINTLYDCNVPIEKRADSVFEIKMEHNLEAEGYCRHEILYDIYSEQEYEKIIVDMLKKYFDPFKKNSLEWIKRISQEFGLINPKEKVLLSLQARKYLGIDDI